MHKVTYDGIVVHIKASQKSVGDMSKCVYIFLQTTHQVYTNSLLEPILLIPSCNIISVVVTPVVNCTSMPTWNGMITNSSHRSWRSVVTTSCREDKMFPNGAKVRILTCGGNAKWQPEIVECVGKLGQIRMTLNIIPSHVVSYGEAGLASPEL